ncbi:hypothetical protein K501DRAFT_333905 [Backusella circina FSU 941]|nr:hypothetical protein K501DRAFT_333905 [Backusella circina FSU 941]
MVGVFFTVLNKVSVSGTYLHKPGRYSSRNKPLILFRLPETETLLYRLSDIKPLFNLPNINLTDYYRDQDDIYLDTPSLANLALEHNRYLLGELCKLRSEDYSVGLADIILETFPNFKRAPKEENIWEFVPLPLEKMHSNEKTKSETRHLMALDKVLLNNHELKQHQHQQQFSRFDPERPNKRQCIDADKGLNKNSRNLTIFAPSYHQQLLGVRSAPLHSNFPKPAPSKSNLAQKPAFTQTVPPASATLAKTPFQKHIFATPIVPSQHPPTAKAKSDVHRQQCLQPFEQLFDTIEATRNLKSTLDDQIRRSSTLIKTLQTLTHTIEDVVKIQVNEVQSEKFSQFEQNMMQIEQRISRLEHVHFKIDSVLPSPGQEEPMKRSSPKSEDYHNVLTTLRDRLDRLERQIDT